jgi:hypothetical protein
MYIRWSGYGGVIVVIQLVICGILPYAVYASSLPDDNPPNEAILIPFIGFLIGAPIMWILGRRLNEYGAEHSLYGIPVEDWGYIPVFSVLWLYFLARLNELLIIGSTVFFVGAILGVILIAVLAYFVSRRRYS